MSPIVKQCIGTRDERCTELIPIGQKRCAKHAAAENRRRSTRKNQKPQMKFYQSAQWRKARLDVLARDLHECQTCGAPATHVDHQPPLTVLIDQGLDPYHPDHCRSLCARCAGRADGHRSQEPPWIG